MYLRTLTDSMCCKMTGDQKTTKQHHWKSEAKRDHPLSPSGPNNIRQLRSQPVKMISFRSEPS